jgi:hypothetical protein
LQPCFRCSSTSISLFIPAAINTTSQTAFNQVKSVRDFLSSSPSTSPL